MIEKSALAPRPSDRAPRYSAEGSAPECYTQVGPLKIIKAVTHCSVVPTPLVHTGGIRNAETIWEK